MPLDAPVTIAARSAMLVLFGSPEVVLMPGRAGESNQLPSRGHVAPSLRPDRHGSGRGRLRLWRRRRIVLDARPRRDLQLEAPGLPQGRGPHLPGRPGQVPAAAVAW